MSAAEDPRAPHDIIAARHQAEEARARLAETLVELQARLNPKALAREAVDELKDAAQVIAQDGLDEIKRHPLKLAGGAAALGLFLARGPIKHLVGQYINETPEPPASLESETARVRRKGTSE